MFFNNNSFPPYSFPSHSHLFILLAIILGNKWDAKSHYINWCSGNTELENYQAPGMRVNVNSSRGEQRFLRGIILLCFYLHNNPVIKHKVPLLSTVRKIVLKGMAKFWKSLTSVFTWVTCPTNRNLPLNHMSKGIMASLWEHYLSLQRSTIMDLEIGSFQT